MMKLLYLPFFMQGILMGIDEFYFHRKRGLPKWERIGHPLDTLSLLACYAILVFTPPTEASLLLFIVLSVFSCLLITKDEKVHTQECSFGEQWIHSVLFILHPIVLIIAAFSWRNEWETLFTFIKYQAFITLLFFIYQIWYWNFYDGTQSNQQ